MVDKFEKFVELVARNSGQLPDVANSCAKLSELVNGIIRRNQS